MGILNKNVGGGGLMEKLIGMRNIIFPHLFFCGGGHYFSIIAIFVPSSLHPIQFHSFLILFMKTKDGNIVWGWDIYNVYIDGTYITYT